MDRLAAFESPRADSERHPLGSHRALSSSALAGLECSEFRMLSASLAPFAVAVLVSAIATLVVRSVPRHRGVVSSPRADRWHPRPTPLLGGVALWLPARGTTLLILSLAAGPAP